MDDKKENQLDINSYYSLVDKNYLTTLTKNNNLKNLINLSTQTDLYIFNKKNKKWQLKSKDKLLKECEQIKKKEIKMSSSMLSNLAKLSKTHDSYEIKNICQKLENKVNNIDKIINCIQNLETLDYDNISTEISTNKFKPNIFSFDDVIQSPKIIIKPKKEIIENTKKDKVINLSNVLNNIAISSSSDSYIECYGNC